MAKVVAIYHKDCSDGTAAASVILKKFPEAHVFPLSYSQTKEELAEIESEVNSDTTIYVVDGVFGVKYFLDKGYKVTAIDHHIGIKDEFEKIAKENSNFTFVFDNNKSGASLTWSYFFPDIEVPEIVKYIQDFDLWKNELGENTKYVGNFLVTHRDDPKFALRYLESNLDEVIEKGRIVSEYVDYTVTDEIKNNPVKLRVGDYLVDGYNISSINSTVGGSILSKKTGRAFVGFRIDGGKVKYSIRSRDEQNPSALDIARILGGSGHRNSCGAATTLKEFLEMIQLSE